MATKIKFVSAATSTARVVLEGDDVAGNLTIKTLNAANATNNTRTLSVDDRNKLCSNWTRGTEAYQVLNASGQFWVTFALDKSSVWSNDDGVDEDTKTEEVYLDTAQTAALMGWIKQGQPVSAA